MINISYIIPTYGADNNVSLDQNRIDLESMVISYNYCSRVFKSNDIQLPGESTDPRLLKIRFIEPICNECKHHCRLPLLLL